jgi:hypothetical protein
MRRARKSSRSFAHFEVFGAARGDLSGRISRPPDALCASRSHSFRERARSSSLRSVVVHEPRFPGVFFETLVRGVGAGALAPGSRGERSREVPVPPAENISVTLLTSEKHVISFRPNADPLPQLVTTKQPTQRKLSASSVPSNSMPDVGASPSPRFPAPAQCGAPYGAAAAAYSHPLSAYCATGAAMETLRHPPRVQPA